MPIRLIACDLDGTLLGPDLVFSSRLLKAIRSAQEAGVVVTIATGRGYPATRGFARQLGIAAPLICYQGAQIINLLGETIYEAQLPLAYLPEAVAFGRERGNEVSIYCNDRIYQTTRMHDQTFYDRWFGLPIQQIEDLSELPGAPIKFIVTARSQQEGDQLEAALRAQAGGRFQVVRSHAWFVEGLAAGVSKGKALARLCAQLGIDRPEVMAVGDSGNDAAMIEWAGTGIAIGNASPDVKAIADVVAPPQPDDGAAWAIEEYALRGHMGREGERA